MEFDVTRNELDDGLVLLVLRGPLQLDNFMTLENEFAALFEKERYKIMIDLAGMGRIVKACSNEGDVVLISPTASVKRVFEVLGLSQSFVFAKDYHDAQRALS